MPNLMTLNLPRWLANYLGTAIAAALDDVNRDWHPFETPPLMRSVAQISGNLERAHEPEPDFRLMYKSTIPLPDEPSALHIRTEPSSISVAIMDADSHTSPIALQITLDRLRSISLWLASALAPLSIRVELKHSPGGMPYGYELLERVLDILGTRANYWQGLQVILPTELSTAQILGLAAFENPTNRPRPTPLLRRFVWKGPDLNLPSTAPWNHPSQLPLSQLTEIRLHCPLSLGDCQEILSQCGNVQELELNWLEDKGSVINRGSPRIQLSMLQSLKLSTSVNPEPLFLSMEMEKLRCIHLAIASQVSTKPHRLCIPWGQLSHVTMLWTLPPLDSDSLRSLCSHAIELDSYIHENVDVIMG